MFLMYAVTKKHLVSQVLFVASVQLAFHWVVLTIRRHWHASKVEGSMNLLHPQTETTPYKDYFPRPLRFQG
jgi:uncharacterized membrane protein